MNDTNISLKPICDLLENEHGSPTQFWIPAYQRGFRWTPLQVTQLLDDIWEFIQSKKSSFYCLQPLVIKDAHEKGDYEVVDGQQRLTTIYILLTYLEPQMLALEKVPFEIHFETRGKANETFLTDIDGSRADENIDFFHICDALKAIDEWFSKQDSTYKLIFLQHLLNTDQGGRNVKVIWFRLSDSDDPVSAFTRLNVGKIPLTNDELIRALFLKRSDGNATELKESQINIATEWDNLEKALYVDEFWYFLNNRSSSADNRISFLFQLIVESKSLPENIKQNDPYWLFYTYNKILKDNSGNLENEWLQIKQVFMMLEEWFVDRKLYHMVGYLIHEGISVNQIRCLSEGSKKSEFERKLVTKICHQIFKKNLSELNHEELRDTVIDKISSVQYGRDNGSIRSILLFFNLATLLENSKSNLRFPFDSFKNEEWDIEHIRSVASGSPERHHERVEWLNRCLEYLNTNKVKIKLCKRISEFISQSQKDASDYAFESLYKKTLSFFKENNPPEDVDHGIANLALLDRNTNRSYKNAVFAVKRNQVLSLDQSGVFIPICTRNVFLKCYSQRPDNTMFWSVEDRNAYQEKITETLINFFKKYKSEFVA